MALSWNEYFKLRAVQNKIRPFLGVPSFLLGTGYVVTQVQFSPMEPIMAMDPPIVYGIGAVCAGVLSYQVGAAFSRTLWKFWYRNQMKDLDKMDRVFYKKIQHYRSERGQSPYVNTMTGTSNLIKSIKNKDQNLEIRQDIYGERIKSVADYRSWLRKQRKWDKEYLGAQAKPIRGVKVE